MAKYLIGKIIQEVLRILGRNKILATKGISISREEEITLSQKDINARKIFYFATY